MNPAQLLAHFDRISEAPDAIPRLRQFILELAVRGLLVVQNPKEKATTATLRRSGVGAEKDSLFTIPASWAWRRLGEIADSRLGKMLDKTKNKGAECRYLRNVNVRWFDFDLSDVKEMRFEDFELDEFALRRGDVLICEGGEPGRAAVWDARDTEIYFQKAIHRVRFSTGVDPHYFVFVLREAADSGRLSTYFTGVGIKHLTGQGLSKFTVPIPPLAEQRRIVATVVELMALCDRLEAAQAERESRRERLAVASLRRLNQPANGDAASFREHARFHLWNLPRLTSRPEQIQQLRQTILNLAVRGRFASTMSWPAKPERLREFATLQNGYAFKSEWFAQSGIRLLRNTNVSHGLISWDDLVCLPRNRSGEFERFLLNEGDIVLSLDRPIIATGIKVARVRPEDNPCLLLQRVGRFLVKSMADLSLDYLFLWLNSPHFSDQINPGRSNGVPHISSKQVEAAEIFIPPLAEQRRTVARAEELMALCDQLEAQLTTSQTDRRRLLESVLHQALSDG